MKKGPSLSGRQEVLFIVHMGDSVVTTCLLRVTSSFLPFDFIWLLVSSNGYLCLLQEAGSPGGVQ